VQVTPNEGRKRQTAASKPNRQEVRLVQAAPNNKEGKPDENQYQRDKTRGKGTPDADQRQQNHRIGGCVMSRKPRWERRESLSAVQTLINNTYTALQGWEEEKANLSGSHSEVFLRRMIDYHATKLAAYREILGALTLGECVKKRRAPGRDQKREKKQYLKEIITHAL
jgi:hypothetical protein